MTSAIDPFLPSIDRARAAGLLPEGLTLREVRKLSALVVSVQLLRRETWRETKRLLPQDAALVPREEPAILPRRFSVWLRGTDAQGRSVLEHVTDKAVEVRDVHIPPALNAEPVLFGVETAIEEVVPLTPHAGLECKDLRASGSSSAYRGELGSRRRPMFQDFDFDGAIELAEASVVQLHRGRGRVVRSAVLAWAWPLLWIKFESPDPATQLVVLADADGQLHAISGAELQREDAVRSQP